MTIELKEQMTALKGAVNELIKTTEQSRKDSDVLVEAKLAKLREDIGSKLDGAQKLEAKQKATDEAIAKLEAAASRMEGGAPEKQKDNLKQHKEAFVAFIRGEREFGNKGVELVEKSMSTDVNPDGGYLVRPEFVSTVVSRVFETSPVRQVANVITTSSKSVEMLIDDDENDANWAGEGDSGAGTETDTAELGILSITAHKLEATPKITQELLDDAYLDVESWLATKTSDKFGRTENTAFVAGNGVLKPRGFTMLSAWTTAGTYERGKLEQINSGSSGAVTADGAINLQNSLLEAYQARAVFMMQRDTYTDYLQLKDTNNQYLFGMEFLKNGQLQPTLLGKRVIFADDMPAVGSNALAVAYGDFSVGYTIVDRIGINVIRDIYSNKGFISFYTTKRTGGDVTNFQAIKLQKLA